MILNLASQAGCTTIRSTPQASLTDVTATFAMKVHEQLMPALLPTPGVS